MKSNPLHTTIFTASFKLEADLLQMVNMVYNGDMETCGAPTYNLDDQAHCVMLAYKNWGKTYKGISNGNLIAFSSIHPRYIKACWNHDIELKILTLDYTGYTDLNKLEGLIDDSTLAILCSAPANATGWLDPVEKLGALAQEHQIGLHVDSAFGMLVPFIEDAGINMTEKFDFWVPGVSTISVGLNNYGQMPPGSAVLLFRTKQLRWCIFFGYGQWPGGLYCAVGLVGSRTSSATAACWTKI